MAFNQETLAASRQPLPRSEDDRGKYVFRKTQQVLQNHSGVGVTTLKLNLSACSMADIDGGLLDAWLRAFVKPGLAELAVSLPEPEHGSTSSSSSSVPGYTFPCSLLLSHDDSASTIQHLYLASCAFHPIQQGPILVARGACRERTCAELPSPGTS